MRPRAACLCPGAQLVVAVAGRDLALPPRVTHPGATILGAAGIDHATPSGHAPCVEINASIDGHPKDPQPGEAPESTSQSPKRRAPLRWAQLLMSTESRSEIWPGLMTTSRPCRRGRLVRIRMLRARCRPDPVDPAAVGGPYPARTQMLLRNGVDEAGTVRYNLLGAGDARRRPLLCASLMR